MTIRTFWVDESIPVTLGDSVQVEGPLSWTSNGSHITIGSQTYEITRDRVIGPSAVRSVDLELPTVEVEAKTSNLEARQDWFEPAVTDSLVTGWEDWTGATLGPRGLVVGPLTASTSVLSLVPRVACSFTTGIRYTISVTVQGSEPVWIGAYGTGSHWVGALVRSDGSFVSGSNVASTRGVLAGSSGTRRWVSFETLTGALEFVTVCPGGSFSGSTLVPGSRGVVLSDPRVIEGLSFAVPSPSAFRVRDTTTAALSQAASVGTPLVLTDWTRGSGVVVDPRSIEFTDVASGVEASVAGVLVPETWYAYSFTLERVVGGVSVGTSTWTRRGRASGYFVANETTFRIAASGTTSARISGLIVRPVVGRVARQTGSVTRSLSGGRNRLANPLSLMGSSWNLFSSGDFEAGYPDPFGGRGAYRLRPQFSLDPGNSNRLVGLAQIRSDLGWAIPTQFSVFVNPRRVVSRYPSPPDTSEASRDVLIRLSSSNNGLAYFNLRTLQIVSTSNGFVRGGVEEWPDGWYRLWYNALGTSLGTGATTVYMTNRISSTFDPYPDGSEDILVYGPQLVQSPDLDLDGDLLDFENENPKTGFDFSGGAFEIANSANTQVLVIGSEASSLSQTSSNVIVKGLATVGSVYSVHLVSNTRIDTQRALVEQYASPGLLLGGQPITLGVFAPADVDRPASWQANTRTLTGSGNANSVVLASFTSEPGRGYTIRGDISGTGSIGASTSDNVWGDARSFVASSNTSSIVLRVVGSNVASFSNIEVRPQYLDTRMPETEWLAAAGEVGEGRWLDETAWNSDWFLSTGSWSSGTWKDNEQW